MHLTAVTVIVAEQLNPSLPVPSRRQTEEPSHSKDFHPQHSLSSPNIGLPKDERQVSISITRICTEPRELSLDSDIAEGDHSVVSNKFFECSICGVKFTTKKGLNSHLRFHKLSCKLCAKRFISYAALYKHTCFHKKTQECKIRRKRFPTPTLLKRRSKTHSSTQQKFQCDLCPRSYYHKSNLHRHGKTHTKIPDSEKDHMTKGGYIF